MKRLFARLDLSDPATLRRVIDYARNLVWSLIEYVLGLSFAAALLGAAHWLFTH